MTEIIAEAVRTQLSRSYASGYTDGVREVIAQLRGESTVAPQGVYRGPVPPELTAWLAAVERRLP